MEQEMMHVLMNGGANVAFAMFLLWQYKEQQRRADDREKKQEDRERELRERYDKVIETYRQNEEAMRSSIVKEINDLDKRLSLLEQKAESIMKIVEEIKAKFMRVS